MIVIAEEVMDLIPSLDKQFRKEKIFFFNPVINKQFITVYSHLITNK